MKYIYYFILLSISVFGQDSKHQEFFPFYDNCTVENEFYNCEREILGQEILNLITPAIENDIIASFKDNMSVLTIAFVYQKNKPIREDIDIDFTNTELKDKIKKFLLDLKPLTKNDSIDDSLKVKRYEFVFLKNQNNKLFIATDYLLIELKYMSEFKYINRPYPEDCTNSINIENCINKYFSSHIVKNFKYPSKAIRKGIEGTVECQLFIDKDGMIIIHNLRGPDQLLEDEAERILKKIPKFIPGTIKGIPVKIPFSIPITFKLD
jgi:TonB family protein